VGVRVTRQGCQGYCKKPIPNRSTAQRHVTDTKLIHTTDSINSDISLIFGRHASLIPVGAPVIPSHRPQPLLPPIIIIIIIIII
jgi:hypothetical protein